MKWNVKARLLAIKIKFEWEFVSGPSSAQTMAKAVHEQ